MFDIKYIFNSELDNLDKTLNFAVVSKKSVSIWKQIIQKYWDTKNYVERHIDTISSRYLEDFKLARQYLRTYGYLFFNYFKLENMVEHDDDIWIGLLFDVIYNELKTDKYKGNLLNFVEKSFLEVDSKKMPRKLAYYFASHPIFVDRYFNNRNEITGLHLETRTIIGKLLCPNMVSLDKNNDENIINNYLNDNCDFFNKLYGLYPNAIISFFRQMIIENWSKTQVGEQIYIIDNINSYTMLCNSMVIVSYILTTNSDFSNSRLPISNYNRNISEELVNSNTNNLLYWLIFDLYKVSFYSLILQNYNNQNNIHLVGTLFSNTYKQNFESNNIYLKNVRYNDIVYAYFLDFISSDILGYVDEDVIYDVLFYINYVIEYKTYEFSAIFSKYVVRFLSKILELSKITNPFIKLKVIKMLYLLQTFYKVDIKTILNSDDYMVLIDNLIKISLYIDKMSGLDRYREAYIYKTNIFMMIKSVSNYEIRDKSYLIMLLNDVEGIVQYTISTASQALISGDTVLIDVLKTYHQIIDSYLTSARNRIEYMNSCMNTNNLMKNMDLDIKYHYIRYLYGVIKNCYDRGSVVIKVEMKNTLTGINENKMWNLYLENVIKPILSNIDEVFEIPGILEMIGRFYPDLPDFFKLIDTEIGENIYQKYVDKYENIREIEFPNDMPEEFLDPLLYTPIRDPIILPESKVIMDRAVIQAHLAEGEYDPFNRQPLTLEQLIEYNNKEEQHQTIMEFIKKRDDWIIRYRSHND